MTIEERLEKLEKELGCQRRWNKQMLVVGMVVVAGLIVIFVRVRFSQMAGITTQHLWIEDESGQCRAQLLSIHFHCQFQMHRCQEH